MSPYVVAGYAIFWRFPSATEREAYVVPSVAEVDRFAHQLDDDSIWLLIEADPPTWKPMGAALGDAAYAEYTGDPTAIYILAKT